MKIQFRNKLYFKYSIKKIKNKKINLTDPKLQATYSTEQIEL